MGYIASKGVVLLGYIHTREGQSCVRHYGLPLAVLPKEFLHRVPPGYDGRYVHGRVVYAWYPRDTTALTGRMAAAWKVIAHA